MKNIFLSFYLVLTVAAGAAPLKIELPIEIATYKPGPGAELANAQCLACHSADYATMQPPKPRDFWKAEVEKMKSKYGAPITTNDANTLTAYFATNYGTDTNAVDMILPFVEAPSTFYSLTCAVFTATSPQRIENLGLFTNQGTIQIGSVTNTTYHFTASAPVMANYGKELATKNGCFTCHQINSKLIGPTYMQIAAKYKGHPDAMAKVAHQITQGGTGQWGTIPMPPFTKFTSEEINALSEWILHLK